jgi:hypothetical protein
MSPSLPVRFLFAVAICCAVPACGSQRDDLRSNASTQGRDARVVGTVLDAASGEPLGGVRVKGPHGTSAVSARDGRFELRGLHEGDAGELVAELSGGETHRQPLRELSAGTIEVVMHVRRR